MLLLRSCTKLKTEEKVLEVKIISFRGFLVVFIYRSSLSVFALTLNLESFENEAKNLEE